MNKKLLKNLVPLIIVAAAVIIAGAIIFISQSKNSFINHPKNSGKTEEGLTKEQVSEKALNYINTELLQGRMTASLVEVSEESGLVKMRVKVGDQEIDSYATKDAKLFFPQAFYLR